MTLLKNKKKFVIIGAGISGLTLACELKKKKTRCYNIRKT